MNRGHFNFVDNSQVHSCDATKHHHSSQFQRQSSPPIPIKASTQPNERDNNRHDAADQDYYNHLTWRMYHRIMEARRSQAYSRLLLDEHTLSKMDSCESIQANITPSKDEGFPANK